MLQVSALPLTYGRQSYDDVVGIEPNFTYMSASPVPPDSTNFRPVAPEGTVIWNCSWLPVVAARLVCATPLVSVVGPGGGGGGVTVPPSAAVASTMPAPQPLHVAGK